MKQVEPTIGSTKRQTTINLSLFILKNYDGRRLSGSV
jgi:hypothetical protein